MAAPEVEFEDFVTALRGAVTGAEYTSALADIVATLLIQTAHKPNMQKCLAALLREQDWTCTPPPRVRKGGA